MCRGVCGCALVVQAVKRINKNRSAIIRTEGAISILVCAELHLVSFFICRLHVSQAVVAVPTVVSVVSVLKWSLACVQPNSVSFYFWVVGVASGGVVVVVKALVMVRLLKARGRSNESLGASST